MKNCRRTFPPPPAICSATSQPTPRTGEFSPSFLTSFQQTTRRFLIGTYFPCKSSHSSSLIWTLWYRALSRHYNNTTPIVTLGLISVRTFQQSGVFRDFLKPPTAWHCVKIKNEPELTSPTTVVPAPQELRCPPPVPQRRCHIRRPWGWGAITGLSGRWSHIWHVRAGASDWLAVMWAMGGTSLLGDWWGVIGPLVVLKRWRQERRVCGSPMLRFC